MDVDRQPEDEIGQMKSSDNEDQAISITGEARKFRDEEDVADAGGNCVATPGESSRKIDQVTAGYVELYDEQLIANNLRCYIQWFFQVQLRIFSGDLLPSAPRKVLNNC